MKRNNPPPLKYVIGPEGTVLTLADLASPNTKRWVLRRKAEIVVAVQGGLLSLEDACERYDMTIEEFLSWQRRVERYRFRGARTKQRRDKTKL